VADGDLIYRQGHGKVRAGYFPPEGAGVMRAQEPDDGGSP
jgi:hypothetical protein